MVSLSNLLSFPLFGSRTCMKLIMSSSPNAFRKDSDAYIRNFALVARIMKGALPDNAKIAKEAKECMQECVSEFISFITSEGTLIYCCGCHY